MTTEEAKRLSEALARAQKAAGNLKPATDQLTEKLAKIERALTDLRLGVTASIELKSEDVEDDGGRHYGTEVTALAFRREGKTWKLMIESGMTEDEHWHSIPLLNASRELRLLAIDRMHVLVERLAEQTEAQVQEVELHRAKADALLAQLQASQATRGKP